MHHFRFVEHYVDVHVAHVIAGEQIAVMVAAQIELFVVLDFEQLFGIRFYLNNGIVIPCGRNFVGLMVLLLVFVNGKMHDVLSHISKDVCMLFHCKA